MFSLKRRQFIERRSYIFHIAENDVVFLQPPEIYTAVCLLSGIYFIFISLMYNWRNLGYLLAHGGVTSSDALFGFFNNCATIPPVLKESISKSKDISCQKIGEKYYLKNVTCLQYKFYVLFA